MTARELANLSKRELIELYVLADNVKDINKLSKELNKRMIS